MTEMTEATKESQHMIKPDKKNTGTVQFQKHQCLLFSILFV